MENFAIQFTKSKGTKKRWEYIKSPLFKSLLTYSKKEAKRIASIVRTERGITGARVVHVPTGQIH